MSAAETSLKERLRARSATERALRRVLQTPITIIGLLVVIFIFLLAIFSESLPLQDPLYMDTKALAVPPGTPGHLFGTDQFGRDILSRVVHGTRISLFIAVVVVSISSVLGSIIGVIVGYAGGLVDSLVSRFWDVLFSFPGIILYLVIVGTVGGGIPIVITAMVIGSIPGYGRLIRERVLALRAREFVVAAQAIGASQWRIMLKHILPNSLTPLLVSAALAIPGVIMGEAGLSYLGLGIPPPTPSWGKMIAEGQNKLEIAPWISLIPGAAILLATLGFNLLSDGLRDFFDPTQLR